MTLKYGYVKSKVISNPLLKASTQPHETQYHLHVSLMVANHTWDVAINVGTNDADDLLQYRLLFDFHHELKTTLAQAEAGFHDLTKLNKLPALDFLRSDVLAETGNWRDSDVMDGSEHPEPVASLKRLLLRAKQDQFDVYIFGRTYTSGGSGIHDIHMNQGSGSQRFRNNGVNDHNDHNDIWQDGAVLVDLGPLGWAAYFTAFTQQTVPTDTLGNPTDGSHPLTDADGGSQIAGDAANGQ